jgi:hypothetical protein
MFNFLKGIFGRKICWHNKNYNSHNYLDENNTPMVYFHCIDCGYTEKGHIIVDCCNKELLKEWVKTKIVRNGKIIKM